MRDLANGEISLQRGNGSVHDGHTMRHGSGPEADGRDHRSTNRPADDGPQHPDAPCLMPGMCAPIGATVVALVSSIGGAPGEAHSRRDIATPPSFLLPPDRPPPRA